LIVETVKAAMFVFPFIKELFLGKDKDKKTDEAKDPKDPKPKGPVELTGKQRLLRQVLIAVAILSVVVNIALIEKLLAMASSMVSLKREVAATRQDGQTPKLRPSDDAPPQPTPQGIESTTKVDPPEPGGPSNHPVVPEPAARQTPEVLPPREEHHQARRRYPANPTKTRGEQPAAPRGEALHNRLRRIEDIK